MHFFLSLVPLIEDTFLVILIFFLFPSSILSYLSVVILFFFICFMPTYLTTAI
jgi:hypothetical protein